MSYDNSSDHLFEILEKIELSQKYGNNSYELKLGINQCMYNTIPLLLMCKNNCNWYVASGVFEDPLTREFKCFETPVFRLNKLDHEEKIAILELLQPQTSNGEVPPFSCKNEVCKFFYSGLISKFIRTGICIKVEINCFGGIECLPPVCARCGIPKCIHENPLIINVETSEYISISDGIKRVYLNSDGIEGFNIIPDPLTFSYSNLFINGMLQPPSFYNIIKGKLTLNTEDFPISGSFIILQLIKIDKRNE